MLSNYRLPIAMITEITNSNFNTPSFITTYTNRYGIHRYFPCPSISYPTWKEQFRKTALFRYPFLSKIRYIIYADTR